MSPNTSPGRSSSATRRNASGVMMASITSATRHQDGRYKRQGRAGAVAGGTLSAAGGVVGARLVPGASAGDRPRRKGSALAAAVTPNGSPAGRAGAGDDGA